MRGITVWGKGGGTGPNVLIFSHFSGSIMTNLRPEHEASARHLLTITHTKASFVLLHLRRSLRKPLMSRACLNFNGRGAGKKIQTAVIILDRCGMRYNTTQTVLEAKQEVNEDRAGKCH